MEVCREKEVIVSVSSVEEGPCVTKFTETIVQAIPACGTHLSSTVRKGKHLGTVSTEQQGTKPSGFS